MRPGPSGEGGTGPAKCEEWQTSTALTRERALTGDLMERICERENLNRAYKRVKANKGAPGIDGMRAGELYEWLKEHKEEVVGSLLGGSYEPQPVLGKEIDKPSGGKRRLGIPIPRSHCTSIQWALGFGTDWAARAAQSVYHRLITLSNDVTSV